MEPLLINWIMVGYVSVGRQKTMLGGVGEIFHFRISNGIALNMSGRH